MRETTILMSKAQNKHAETEHIISCQNLSYSYTKESFIEHASFDIELGDFVGIIGSNGSGKTTLIKLLLGLLQADSGTIQIANKTPKKARKHIAYLSQFGNIDFEFPITAQEIVSQGITKTGLFSRTDIAKKDAVDAILEELSLTKHRHKKLSELSGGQKQRVFLARALIQKPKILILDEPLANIDVTLQEELYKTLQELNKKTNMTILVVDHNVQLLSEYAKTLICLDVCDKHSIKTHNITKKQAPKGCKAC